MALTDLVAATDLPPSTEDESTSRWIDRLDRRVVWVLTALGFALPVGLCIWLVGHFGVNVVTGDQFDDVTVIRASYTHLFSWGALWSQHNENRIFFPNLVVLLLSRTTRYNIKIEEFVGMGMLFVSTALVILTHRRRAPDTPWLYYCPVAILMLSIVQFGNLLWGFQMAWFLVLLAVTLTLFLLDRVTFSWPWLVLAMVVAVVASYSSLQGLLVWPAGLVLFYHRRRPWTMVVTWLAGAVVTMAGYFHNYDSHVATSPHGYAITHPLASLEYFGIGVGDVLGIPFRGGQAYNLWLVAFGLIVVAVSVWVVIRYGVRRDEHGSGPFAVTLVILGLLFVAVITQGRIVLGAWSASASRYTTFDLLIPAGVYLALLTRPTSRARGTTAAPAGRAVTASVERRLGSVDRWTVPAARIFIGLLIVIQVAVSLPNAVKGARDNYTYQTKAAEILLHYRSIPKNELVFELYIFSNARFIRQQAATLERHHLSVFAGTHQGLPAQDGPPPTTRPTGLTAGTVGREPPMRPTGST